MNNKVWIARETSSWDKADPDIWRPYFLPKSLIEHLDVTDEVKDKADFAADRIKDELETALVNYQTIMSADFAELNLSKQRAAYESLYSDLWTLYKDRMQNYLKHLDIDIGFIFAKNDKEFNEYAAVFAKNNPDNAGYVVFAEQQRSAWQNGFAKYRNAHEHHGDLRGDVKDYDSPNNAKRLFAQVCWTMETTIASLGSYKLKREWNVIDNDSRSTVFDRKERFTIEHAFTTQQKEKMND